MPLPNNPYRLVQTIHADEPRQRAWASLEHQAALQLWAQLKEADRPGGWFAVRVRQWDQPGDYWKYDLCIDLDVIHLSDHEPPRYAPNYETMPTTRLMLTAGQELTRRVHHWMQRLFR